MLSVFTDARVALAELVDVVNQEDTVVGSAPLDVVTKAGLLHRAVAVIVYVDENKIILQRRSRADNWHPGLWTLSSTGHVKKGEGYEEAARRELFEELGLERSVMPLDKLLLPPFSDRGLIEHEIVAVFRASTKKMPSPNPDEIEELALLDLKRPLPRRFRLTPDAELILRRISPL